MTTISTLVVVYASLLTLDWTADQVQANKLCEKYCREKPRWKSCLSRHRIINGDPSFVPWRALLETTELDNSLSYCSGSLVCISNEPVIVTASHCFSDE
ncbi:unnamed protein product [Soboliphyme baturini]|uniref:Peptidase S1 domain-containing protein n=1 Tax=Soboliphyme baturini TaxID=241478 RepID=A0A183IDY0_9BILA|nr:unnamed protein product [Soboliphyme baturini]